MRLGFIGLGTMGANIASNLQTASHEFIVHDLRREAAEPHIAVDPDRLSAYLEREGDD